MKPVLEKGATTTRRLTVDVDRTIDYMGEALRIYATPIMVQDVERTCRLFLEEHLDDTQSSVGSRIELDHLGPTLLGMSVDIRATVSEIEGRRVTFAIDVNDAIETVGRARHVRYIVDRARQKERIEAKAAKAKRLEGWQP